MPLKVWDKEIFHNFALYIFVSKPMQNLNSYFKSDFKIHTFERFPSLFSEIIDFFDMTPGPYRILNIQSN